MCRSWWGRFTPLWPPREHCGWTSSQVPRRPRLPSPTAPIRWSTTWPIRSWGTCTSSPLLAGLDNRTPAAFNEYIRMYHRSEEGFMTDVLVPAQELDRRTIRRSDWVSCNAAFIDCRTPGSDQKSNYAFIGSGVSQNADQFVNLTELHGYNLGAAGMPNGISNNLH